MRPRSEDRYCVDFPIFLSWQGKNGAIQRVAGRCVDLSGSGAKLETQTPLEPRAPILVHSGHFGRMGTASVKYCVRKDLKYEVGLQFNAVFGLSDPVRKRILEQVLATKAER